MRLFLLLLSAVHVAYGEPQAFVSPPTRTHLVELFTSEGCSSCPPAEAWLGKLRDEPGLWREFVPVAWHVDYWDRLGWKDRFASRDATQRQHAYANAWRSNSVYTPCFALDGREWRGPSVPGASNERVGILRASFDGGNLSISFAAASPERHMAHAVILAMDIASKVTRGENRGRELRHDFVAATLPQHAPLRDGRGEIFLQTPAKVGASKFAIAVWITRGDDLSALQATGGPLTLQRPDQESRREEF
jgi:hypothetical protein